MLKTFKFTGNEDDFFFVSDLHWGHDRDFIYTKRGFTDVTTHDNTLRKNWNDAVAHDKTVFHLGDLIFNDPKGMGFWNLVRSLNFKELYLLLGNHTSGQRQAYLQTIELQFPGAYNILSNTLNWEVYPLITNLGNKRIIFMPEYMELYINSTALVLCHYPIMSFHGDGKNTIHLCGHSHGNCKESHPNTGLGQRLDVGIENFGKPINLKQIKQILSKRTPHTYDHHGA